MSRPSLSVTQPLPAPRSLTGELVARLTDDITSGKIPPGSQLPTEQELIAATGVSRCGTGTHHTLDDRAGDQAPGGVATWTPPS